jgi:hypothetical protein
MLSTPHYDYAVPPKGYVTPLHKVMVSTGTYLHVHRADFVWLWKSYGTDVLCRVLAFWLDEKSQRAIWLVEKISSMPCCDRAVCCDFSHSYTICSNIIKYCNQPPFAFCYHWFWRSPTSKDSRPWFVHCFWGMSWIMQYNDTWCYISLFHMIDIPQKQCANHGLESLLVGLHRNRQRFALSKKFYLKRNKVKTGK